MYLESILVLSQRKNTVRAIDIVEEAGFFKPSVSQALGKLKEQKYILVDGEVCIALAGSGKKSAKRIYARHTLLSKLLISLGADEQTAAADACKIEHDVSDKTFEAIKKKMPGSTA